MNRISNDIAATTEQPLLIRIRNVAAEASTVDALRSALLRFANELEELARQIRSDACDLHQALCEGFDSETVENARNSLDYFAKLIDGQEPAHDADESDEEVITAYCGSMTREHLTEHIAQCDPCSKDFG